jgi:hypothetical protein
MRRNSLLAGTLAFAFCPLSHASPFKGEALETVANVTAWIALIIVPIIGIYLFWMLHILPEKIAEKRKHPQAPAIKALCLLSLFFGGLLWPLAMLWAYTRPTLFKLAYGREQLDHHEHQLPAQQWTKPVSAAQTSGLEGLDREALLQLKAAIDARLAAPRHDEEPG